MMLQIVVEAAGTVCDGDCSIFSQTVERQPPPTADQHSSLISKFSSLQVMRICVNNALDILGGGDVNLGGLLVLAGASILHRRRSQRRFVGSELAASTANQAAYHDPPPAPHDVVREQH